MLFLFSNDHDQAELSSQPCSDIISKQHREEKTQQLFVLNTWPRV